MTRIVAAADRQRERAAGQLRREVEPSLLRARVDVAAVRGRTRNLAIAQTLGIVEQELALATQQVADLVAGIVNRPTPDGAQCLSASSLIYTFGIPLHPGAAAAYRAHHG
jgi:hypothetical protein